MAGAKRRGNYFFEFVQNLVNTYYKALYNRQNQLRFVYTHFKSYDQSLDKTSFDFSDKFHAMQCCAMNAKSSIIPKLPMGMVI